MTNTQIIENGMLKYKAILEQLLIEKLQQLYGGPAKWQTMMQNTEEAEEFAVDIWNEAIKAAIDIVSKKDEMPDSVIDEQMERAREIKEELKVKDEWENDGVDDSKQL